jgi:hypothetical protein
MGQGRSTATGSLPLRDELMPTLDSATNFADRLCAGGPLALFAAARPASHDHGSDYVLLIQERSPHVLNASRRLAVIPKAFHGPLSDWREDAPFSATLEREMEEELFGREDVDTALNVPRHADPMHPSQLSSPMRWLNDHRGSDAWRMEATGLGINLVSGNFELASLVVIHDPEWWTTFGGHVAANWESHGIRRCSTLDTDQVAELIHDPSWSNEGLFAFILGLRRLNTLDDARVDLPAIEWEGQ